MPALVRSSVRTLQRALEAADGLAVKAHAMRFHAESVATNCDPHQNAESFRLCQDAAVPGIPVLLALARQSPDHSVRITALEALARVCFNHREAAAEAASSEGFLPAVEFALRPVTEFRGQEEQMFALHFIQGVSGTAPEAPAVAAALGHVLPLLCPGEAAYPTAAAVRSTALGVFLSCSFCPSRRRRVAQLLAAPVAQCILDSAAGEDGQRDAQPFIASLLFANICDQLVPDSAEPDQVFAELAMPLWESGAFFQTLAPVLEASFQRMPWPPGSQTYYSPTKLVSTCAHLATSGHVDKLKQTVSSLVSVVEARAELGNAVVADDAFSARKAAEALNALQADEEVLVAMRDASATFVTGLRLMEAEEPAAVELLAALEG